MQARRDWMVEEARTQSQRADLLDDAPGRGVESGEIINNVSREGSRKSGYSESSAEPARVRVVQSMGGPICQGLGEFWDRAVGRAVTDWGG